MWTFVKIVIWGLLWFPIWIFTLPFKKGRDNCLIWTLRKFDTEGGYICIRWCRSNKIPMIKWPHFLWLPPDQADKLQHIVPVDEVGGEEHKLPVPWFAPENRVGDKQRDDN